MSLVRAWMRQLSGASAATLFVPGAIFTAMVLLALTGGFGALGGLGQAFSGPSSSSETRAASALLGSGPLGTLSTQVLQNAGQTLDNTLQSGSSSTADGSSGGSSGPSGATSALGAAANGATSALGSAASGVTSGAGQLVSGITTR